MVEEGEIELETYTETSHVLDGCAEDVGGTMLPDNLGGVREGGGGKWEVRVRKGGKIEERRWYGRNGPA